MGKRKAGSYVRETAASRRTKRLAASRARYLVNSDDDEEYQTETAAQSSASAQQTGNDNDSEAEVGMESSPDLPAQQEEDNAGPYKFAQYLDRCINFGFPDIRNRQVTWEGYQQRISDMKDGVQSIHFDEKMQITDQHLDDLISALGLDFDPPYTKPTLLDFHCGGYSAVGSDSNLTDAGVMRFVKRVPSLKQASFTGAALTDLALEACAIGLPQLRYLDISSNKPGVSNIGASAFTSALRLLANHDNLCSSLRCLVILWNPNVPLDLILQLTAQRPNLEITRTEAAAEERNVFLHVTYRSGAAFSQVRVAPTAS